MKILFVLECANQPTNGTTASCIRFAKELEKKGHEVSIIGCDRIMGEKYHRYYGLPKYHFPVTDPLIVKGGFLVCRCIQKTIREAVKGQDVVHLFLPFKLSNVCRLIAQEEGIAVTTAFHIVPQNVTAAMHLAWSKLINGILLYSFKRYLYNQVKYVHCPSPMAADIMRKHNFKNNEPRVFSNGVIPFFKKMEVARPKEYEGKFIVCMSGRLVDEKRQDLLIKAVAKSKYNDKIQVILCGQGTNYKYYSRLGKKLANPIKIKFCTAEEVRDILNYIDLYVHASDYEIEGIAAIEAITCGRVALISDSKYCATKDFAVDKELCLFKHGSSKDLRKKIEWFYEHPDELHRLEKEYLDSSEKYALSHQVDSLEQMFYDAIKDQKEGKDLHTLHPRKKDKVLLKRANRAMVKQEKHPERYL
ncbi:MAG: glycosyltransferase [Bacilli bacterium]|nr:glycosyltransferase [Bacilli bacterium]